MNYQTPDFSRRAFARTNAHTIAQRVQLLQEHVPPNSVVVIVTGSGTPIPAWEVKFASWGWTLSQTLWRITEPEAFLAFKVMCWIGRCWQ